MDRHESGELAFALAQSVLGLSLFSDEKVSREACLPPP
jgi:hypothetical protein